VPVSVSRFWRYIRPLLPPVLLCALVVFILREPVSWWLHGEEKFDQEAIVEWVRETRQNKTLPELSREYLDLHRQLHVLAAEQTDDERRRIAEQQFQVKKQEIEDQLKAMGNVVTKRNAGQLPLFPVVYRLAIHFEPKDKDAGKIEPILWDSERPRQANQYRELDTPLLDSHEAVITVQYTLHAYTQRQAYERQEVTRRLWLSGLGVFTAVTALIWIYISQRRERDRQRRQAKAEQQVGEAERLRLHEELRRQEAERQKEEAERQALELKSQLFANIGIMAGSYAHNIKNLLVRPNDLLRRCLDDGNPPEEQHHMLREVRQTLGTVTERLQQILKTVNRDPSQSERARIDLNAMVEEIHRTWGDLARDKWKLYLVLDLEPRDEHGKPLPLWIEGDLSHLQQVLENLLTNARDATFEMRNHMREQARSTSAITAVRSAGKSEPRPAEAERRHALIAAAAWKGEVILRTRRQNDQVILEVQDNGIGMTEEVRRRCVETHYSTKRNNALFAGLSAGMGLGLSFVTVILGHHRATLEIDSEPLKGAVFRVCFPAAG
jgi:two-component system, cell cycle sensor histidine kinase and response regulator CckA